MDNKTDEKLKKEKLERIRKMLVSEKIGNEKHFLLAQMDLSSDITQLLDSQIIVYDDGFNDPYELISCYFDSGNLTFEDAMPLFESVADARKFYLFLVLISVDAFVSYKEEVKAFSFSYTSSEKVPMQIQRFNEDYDDIFDIKEYLNNIVQFRKSMMSNEDAEAYDKLPEIVEIHRGMSKREFKSGNYGISWTLDKEVAEFFTTYWRSLVSTKN